MAGHQKQACAGCWREVYRDELDSADGMCPDCTETVSTRPPPPGRSEQWQTEQWWLNL
jgi:predicted amidophosphoribosyltransferase